MQYTVTAPGIAITAAPNRIAELNSATGAVETSGNDAPAASISITRIIARAAESRANTAPQP